MLALYIVAGIILFLFLVLLIPVDFTFGYKTGLEKAASLRAHWFFGMVTVDLRKRLQRQRPKKTRRRPSQRFRRIGIDTRVLSALLKLATRLVCTLQVKRLSGYLQFGFDDPADTGMVFGLIQPLVACISLPASASFRIEPDFSTPGFRADMKSGVRVYPLKVIGTVSRFVCSSDGWYVVRRLVRMRRR